MHSSSDFKPQIYTVIRSRAVLKATPASSLALLSRNPEGVGRRVDGLCTITTQGTAAGESSWGRSREKPAISEAGSPHRPLNMFKSENNQTRTLLSPTLQPLPLRMEEVIWKLHRIRERTMGLGSLLHRNLSPTLGTWEI